MTQVDYNIGNQSGAAFRVELNQHLEAIATLNSGLTEPPNIFANMWWFDETTNLLKQRDASNLSWVIVAKKDTTGWIPYWGEVPVNEYPAPFVTLEDRVDDPAAPAAGTRLYVKEGALKAVGQSTVSLGVPTGVILPYGAASAPDGWLLCNGAAVSRSTYVDLFVVIGTTFGPGDGSTTFTLPDMRDRFAMGASASRLLGSTGGSLAGVTGAGGDHDHGGVTNPTTLSSSQIPSHSHNIVTVSGDGVIQSGFSPSTSNTTGLRATSNTGGGGSHTHGIATSGTHTHTVPTEPARLALNYIIKT